MSPSRWGIVGLGRAGQARARAIDARPHLTLAGTAGRRPGRGTTTFAAMLADPAVDGLIICSENAHHAEAAARALDAGKHTIVEFPLAATAAEARDLFDRAQRAGRLLHTELIGQLTARHRSTRAYCRTETVEALTIRFTARTYRWITDEVKAGRVGQLAIARLHALHDLLGPLALDDVRCAFVGEGYRLEARFTGASGARVVLDEQRGPELKRGSVTTGRLADGRDFDPPPVDEPGDLFGQDLDRAIRRAEGDPKAAYVADETVLDMLALAERISAAAAP